jgi:hypothetical protein
VSPTSAECWGESGDGAISPLHGFRVPGFTFWQSRVSSWVSGFGFRKVWVTSWVSGFVQSAGYILQVALGFGFRVDLAPTIRDDD